MTRVGPSRAPVAGLNIQRLALVLALTGLVAVVAVVLGNTLAYLSLRDRYERAEIEARWHPQWGDRIQELVFIGIDMDEVQIYDSLQQCLLTDAEMRLGPAQWRNFADPFPIWNKTVEEVLSES